MRIIKILTTIGAALALMLVPAAAQARERGHHGARAHGKAAKKLGVVRSFRGGILTIRMPGRRSRSAEVTDDTALSCKSARKARRKPAKASRKGRRPVPKPKPKPVPKPKPKPKPKPRRGRIASRDIDSPFVPLVEEGDDPLGDEEGDQDVTGGEEEPAEPGDDAEESAPEVDEEDDAGDDEAEPRPRKRRRGGCSTANLRRGVRVKAAKRQSGPGGAVWTKLVLLRR